ncbi:unnamed protein product [Amoebophrya sp. A25]|nr:unnamed protein product [Amoebophrya sp. A25]|eukprot:GSA25T00007711001.1
MGDVDPYEILGLPRHASDSEVRSQFKRMARHMHPDKGGETAAFQRLLSAYELLNDPQKRRQLDFTQTADPYRGDEPTPPCSPRPAEPFGTRAARDRAQRVARQSRQEAEGRDSKKDGKSTKNNCSSAPDYADYFDEEMSGSDSKKKSKHEEKTEEDPRTRAAFQKRRREKKRKEAKRKHLSENADASSSENDKDREESRKHRKSKKRIRSGSARGSSSHGKRREVTNSNSTDSSSSDSSMSRGGADRRAAQRDAKQDEARFEQLMKVIRRKEAQRKTYYESLQKRRKKREQNTRRVGSQEQNQNESSDPKTAEGTREVRKPEEPHCWVKVRLRKPLSVRQWLHTFGPYGALPVIEREQLDDHDHDGTTFDSNPNKRGYFPVDPDRPLWFRITEGSSSPSAQQRNAANEATFDHVRDENDVSLKPNEEYLMGVASLGGAWQIALTFHRWDEVEDIKRGSRETFKAIELMRCPFYKRSDVEEDDAEQDDDTPASSSMFLERHKKRRTVIIVTRKYLEIL